MSVELETVGQKMELYQNPTDFENLPVEMRIRLFSYLGRRDLLHARLTAKAFDQVVRLTNFEKLKLPWWTLSDDTARNLIRSHTRHRMIMVQNLERRQIRESNALKYARKIMLLDRVHKSNVSKIFKQLTSVEELIMSTSDEGVLTATILYLRSNDNFRNIKRLGLYVGVTKAESEFMSALTKDRHFPHLQALDFQWSIDMVQKRAPGMWTPRTYNFIWRTYVSLYKLAWLHRESLTTIWWDLSTVKWLELRIRRDRSGISPAERMELDDLKYRLTDPWKLQIIDIMVLSWENMNNSWSLNNSLLKAQNTLIDLTFKADSILEPEVEALEVIGKKNKDSLEFVAISIASASLRSGSQFHNLNPETFSQCQRLKSLDLKLPNLDPFLLSSLSPGLKTLSVHYTVNPWVEVNPILSRHVVDETLRHIHGRFPNLWKLHFHFCDVRLKPLFRRTNRIYRLYTYWSPMMREFTSSLPKLCEMSVVCSRSRW